MNASINHRRRLSDVKSLGSDVTIEALGEVLENEVQTAVLESLQDSIQTAIEVGIKHALEKLVAEGRIPALAAAEAQTALTKDGRVESNGVLSPAPGGVCDLVWQVLDGMYDRGKNPSIDDIRKESDKRKWNKHNTEIEFYRWRKFHGIVSGKNSKKAEPVQYRRRSTDAA